MILENNDEVARISGTLFEYIKAIFEASKEHITIGLVVSLLIFVVVGYLIAYPIGHGMMVSYVQQHSGSKALKT